MLVPIANAWRRDGASSRIAGQCSFDGWPGRAGDRSPARGTCSPSLSMALERSEAEAEPVEISSAPRAPEVAAVPAPSLETSLQKARRRARAETNRSKRSHRHRANKRGSRTWPHESDKSGFPCRLPCSRSGMSGRRRRRGRPRSGSTVWLTTERSPACRTSSRRPRLDGFWRQSRTPGAAGPSSKIAGPIFYRWLAKRGRAGEPSEGDLLAFALERGMVSVS